MRNALNQVICILFHRKSHVHPKGPRLGAGHCKKCGRIWMEDNYG
jgi:hypothetical protein